MSTESQATPEVPPEVEALYPEMGGVWEVFTSGTRHIWDLDEMTYVRIPGPETRAGCMVFDGTPMPITRVHMWPTVGHSFFVWYDDPDQPDLLERYRISSRVRRIRPYEPPSGLPGVREEAGDGR